MIHAKDFLFINGIIFLFNRVSFKRWLHIKEQCNFHARLNGLDVFKDGWYVPTLTEIV